MRPLLALALLTTGALAACTDRPAEAPPAGTSDTTASEPAPSGGDPSAPAAADSAGLASADFDTFVGALRGVVDRRDAEALRRVLADDVASSFGGDGGPAGFEQAYRPADPDGPAWTELGRLLGQGPPARQGEILAFPWAYTTPPDSLAANERAGGEAFGVTARDGAVIRDEAGATLARAPYGAWLAGVPRATHPDGSWAVRVPGSADRTGLVRRADTFAPYDRRVGFRLLDGRWRLVFLIAGD